MAVGNLVVTLDLDGRQFHSAIQGSQRDLERFAASITRASKDLRSLDHHTRSWGRSLRDTFIVLGLARAAIHNLVSVVTAIPAAIIKSNAELERMTALMRGLDNSTADMTETAENAEKTLARLFEISSASPFDVNAVADSFVKMKSAGLDPLSGSLQGLIDSVAKFGGTSEQLKRASIAIQQMAGKGVISMEELRQQLGEAVPNAMQVMSRATGLSMSKMVKIISEGKLDAKTALAAFARQLQLETSGSALAMSRTWIGTMNRLKNEWTLFMKVVGGGETDGAFAAMKDALNDLVDTLASDPRVEEFGVKFGKAMVVAIDNTRELIVSLSEIGAALGPAVSDAIMILRELASVVASLTQLMAEHADVVAFLVKTYATFKLASIIGLWTSRLGEAAKATVAFGAAQASLTKSSGILALGTAMTQVTASTGRFTQTLIKAEVVARGFAIRAAALATGMKALGASILTAIGPLGFLAMGLMAAYEVYQKTIGAHKEYVDLLKQNPEYLDEADRKTLESGLASDQERLAQIQAHIREREAVIADANARRFKGYKDTIADAEREIKNGLKSIDEITDRMTLANGQLGAAAFQGVQRAVQASSRAALEEIAKGYDKIQKEYENKLANSALEISQRPNMTAAERDEANVQASLEAEKWLTDEKRKLLEGFIAHKEAVIKRADGEEKKTLVAALEVYKAELQSTINLQTRLGVTIRESSKEGKALQNATTILNGYARSIAVVQEKMNEGKTEAAKLQARITNGEFNGVDAGTIQRLRDQAAALDEVNAAYKRITDADKAFERLSERTNQLVASVAGLTARAEDARNPWIQLSGAAAKASSEAAETIKQFNEELNKLDPKDERNGTRIAQITKEVERLQALQPAAELAVATRGFEAIKEAVDDYAQSTMGAADAANFAYQRQLADLEEFMTRSAEIYGPRAKEIYDSYLKMIEDMRLRASNAVYKLAKDWEQQTSDVSTLWASGIQEMSNALTDFIVEGEANFDSFLKNIYRMIVDFMVQKMVSQFLLGMMGGWGAAPAGGESGFNLSSIGNPFAGQSFGTDFANGGIMTNKGAAVLGRFANGGIMTQYGSLPLQKYARGGIAHRPQVALYGEGAQPEAYVPLPDGRSIPVTMKGNDAGRGDANVQVNVLNQTSQQVDAEATSPRFDGERWIVDVVLKNMSKPGRFRETMKAAVKS